MFEVISPGPFTTVQDRGRPGYYAGGFPPSGALDRYSHDAANAVLGNHPDAATLEVTFHGPVLRFEADALVALTGAQVEADLDGVAVPGWRSQPVRRGQTLRIGPTLDGARAYLAVRGGVDVPSVMGSRSTYVTSKIGGVRGRPLAVGDRLGLADQVLEGSRSLPGVRIPDELRPAQGGSHEIRVVPGLCDYRLTGAAQQTLYSTPYQIDAESNRTGYRLKGEPLTFVERDAPFGAGSDPSNVVNLGYPVGSIQVPNGGELICLLRDAVTGGGYATVGTVISADVDVLARSASPDEVLFVPVDIDVAIAERSRRSRRVDWIADLYAGRL